MSTGKKSHSPDSFVPSNPLARKGYLRMVSPSEMVVAYQCPCGQLIPPQDSIRHRLVCDHPAKAQGRTITIPLPSLILVQTTRGVMVVEGMETPEDKAKFGPCPFPPATDPKTADSDNKRIDKEQKVIEQEQKDLDQLEIQGDEFDADQSFRKLDN